MSQYALSNVITCIWGIGMAIMIVALIKAYHLSMDRIKAEEARNAKAKNLDHPLFKLSLTDAEKYLAEIYLKKMVYVIHKDISKIDPNYQDEIFSRTLVEFNKEFVDIADAMASIYGPHYLNNFAINTFNQLLLNGDISKLVNKYAV